MRYGAMGVCVLAAIATLSSAGLADGVYSMRFPINADESPASVGFLVTTFDQAGTSVAAHTTRFSGWIDVRVDVVAGDVAGVLVLGARLLTGPVSGEADIPGLSGADEATLRLRELSVESSGSGTTTSARSASGGAGFALTGNLAYAGLVDLEAGGLLVTGIAVSGGDAGVPWLSGLITLTGDTFALSGGVQLGDPANQAPGLPTLGGNLGVLGSGAIASTVVIPAPASLAVPGLLALAPRRRFRQSRGRAA